MKIFITGINGFIGTNLLSYLKVHHPGYECSGLSRAGNAPAADVPVYRLPEEAPEYDVMVHLAGKAHDIKKVADDSVYYDANFVLTKTLFDKFLSSTATTFIFISSVKAAADEVPGVLTEEQDARPATPYGKTKLMAEQYLLSQQLPAGKKVYILRPAMVHGPGCKGNLNLLYKLVSNGIPYPLGSFENQRSYLSVENLCFVIDQLIHKNVPSGIYNVADDESLSTKEVVALISDGINRRPRIMRVPRMLIKMAAAIGNAAKLPLNSETLQKLTASYVVSNDRIKKALGAALPLSTRSGLSLTIKYLKEDKQ